MEEWSEAFWNLIIGQGFIDTHWSQVFRLSFLTSHLSFKLTNPRLTYKRLVSLILFEVGTIVNFDRYVRWHHVAANLPIVSHNHVFFCELWTHHTYVAGVICSRLTSTVGSLIRCHDWTRVLIISKQLYVGQIVCVGLSLLCVACCIAARSESTKISLIWAKVIY